MKWPSRIRVTDQEIDISWLSEVQLHYFADLGERLRRLYLQLGKGRHIFTLSGPAGSGKSVIAALLKYFFKDRVDFEYANVGLDAFHFFNEDLEAWQLREVKGRFDTYNTSLLLEKLQQFKSGKTVTFPEYSRKLHKPVLDAVSIEQPNVLMLLEGQWLLRNTPEWEAIRELCSYQLFVTGPAESLRENVINRHIAGGRSPEEAAAFYEQSDLLNTQEVLERGVEPDETLLFYKDIEC